MLNKLLTKYLYTFIIFALLLCHCHMLVAEERPVVILLSDTLAAYQRTADDFAAETKSPIKVFNLHGDIRKDPQLKQKLFGHNPKLIFALGAKAAFVAKVWTKDRQEIPVIFAKVLNWSKYKLLSGQKNISGIAAETDPGNQFSSIALFAPDIKRVGVIYNKKQSAHIIKQAKLAAAGLGFELIVQAIDSARDLRYAYNQMSNQVDAFWMLNDPVSFTVENMAWMNKRCIQHRLVCVGQSENAAKLGFLLSVNPDQKNIGSQAASLANSILLRGKSPHKIGAMPPLGTEILVNLKTAEKLGIQISTSSLAFATEVIN